MSKKVRESIDSGWYRDSPFSGSSRNRIRLWAFAHKYRCIRGTRELDSFKANRIIITKTSKTEEQFLFQCYFVFWGCYLQQYWD